MKKIIIPATLSLVFFLSLSNTAKFRFQDPIFKILGITNNNVIIEQFFCANADNCVFAAPPMSNLSSIRVLASANKVKVATESLNYLKNYFNSEEFIAKYQDKRMSQKPPAIELSDDIKQLYTEQLEQYQEMYSPEVLGMLPEESKAGALQQIETLQAALEGDMEPDAKKKWEQNYPSNPNALLKRALLSFLEKTQNIDYNATTTLNPKNKHLVCR